MTQATETVGFVGVGLMGHGIAKNILAGGYPLHIIAHRNREPVDDLVSKGAQEAQSLDELGAAASVVFVCAPGSPQVEAIVTALSAVMASGSVIIDCSTSDPVSTTKLAGVLADKELHLVDAPLGGTPVQAEEGKLSAMIGGEDAVVQRITPVIECWAATIVHIGGVGNGHRMKLLNNFLSLGYGALYSEALVLGQKVGLSPEKFDSVIRGSRMDCGFYQTFMGHMIEGNRDSHKFTLTNAYKDMRYLEAMANDAGIANPIGTSVKSAYARAIATGGDGAEDYVPHLPEFVGRSNGVEMKPKG
ncbi:MAG: NAD(P)-dependent oxidoreductase [Pseudomonadota bacterium]